jgi:acetyl esterase
MKKIWGLILIISFVVYYLFVKDSHIKVEYKIAHYFNSLTELYSVRGGKFKREKWDYIYNYLGKEPESTNGNFKDGLMIEDVELESKKRHLDLDIQENILDLQRENMTSKFKLKIYLSQKFIENKTNNKKLPVLVYIHGGGFVKNYHYKNDFHFAREGMLVISVIYRLAPENKFPAALEDCYTSLEWLLNSKHELIQKYADLEKVAIIGDSAGGNLAAVLPSLIRSRKLGIKISHQILVYPCMNTLEPTDSKSRIGDSGYILTEKKMIWYYQQYISDKRLYQSPLVNPLKNKDFSEMPPALIFLATEDILYSEGKTYADFLKAKGVDVEIIEFNSVHGCYCMNNFPEEKLARDQITLYLKKRKFINN